MKESSTKKPRKIGGRIKTLGDVIPSIKGTKHNKPLSDYYHYKADRPWRKE